MSCSKIGLVFLFFSFVLSSCLLERNTIFHAGPSTGGAAGGYFELYNNGKYRICNSGPLSEDCYIDKFTLVKDTIILHNLPARDFHLKFNRFLIVRYNEQDSSYWIRKYSDKGSRWKEMKWADEALENEGDVLQLDTHNNIVFDESNYFVIVLDKLKNYR